MIFGNPFERKSSRSRKLDSGKESSEGINVVEILRDPAQRREILGTLKVTKNKIPTLDEVEKEEWVTFFKGVGCQNLREVSGILTSFIGILEEKNLLKAIAMAGKKAREIARIAKHLDSVQEFLRERGVTSDEGEARKEKIS